MTSNLNRNGTNRDGPWVIRCARGLYRAAVDEMRFRKVLPHGAEPLVIRQRNHDLLFAQRLSRTPTTTRLRTAEEILQCLVYGRYKLSHAQLDRLAASLSSAEDGYRLAVSVDGTHFSRREFRAFLESELRQRGALLSESATETLFVFCIDASYYIGRMVSRASDAEFRNLRVAERPGSLPPTIAAAMAFLGRPSREETILDPVCGSGTLIAEAYAYSPLSSFVGIDLDPQAVAIARQNLAGIEKVRIFRQDSTGLRLQGRPVDLFLANLPFGKQFGSRSTNAQLYLELLRGMERAGTVGAWRSVVLTSDHEAMRLALSEFGSLDVQKSIRVQVRGEAAQILVCRRRSGAGSADTSAPVG